ncbi:MAG: hypothetical protein Tsb0020_42410 [Haliangiales bacterium]
MWLMCAGEDEPVAQRMARAMSGWGWPVEVCASDAERAEQPEFVEQLMGAGAVVAVAGPEGRGPWRALASRRALLALVRRGYSELVVGMLADASSQNSPMFLRTIVHLGADVTHEGHERVDALAASPLMAKLAALRGPQVFNGDRSLGTRSIMILSGESSPVARSIEATKPPQARREPERGAAHIAESAGMRFVWLPGGTFMMGSDEGDVMAFSYEKPAHPVTVSGLWMAETPVTNRAYGELLESAQLGEPEYWRDRRSNQPEQPVVGVSWYQAVRFCNALSAAEGLEPCYLLDGSHDAPTVAWQREAEGYRLPTEAEWEYACRAGTTTRWWFGDSDDQLVNYAWYRENSDGAVKPVAGKSPNPWGLYDMHGNVWEWSWDWFAEYPNAESPTPLLNPAGPSEAELVAKSRTLRGGAFGSSAQYLRAAFRNRNAPAYRHLIGGFRCVRDGRAQQFAKP